MSDPNVQLGGDALTIAVEAFYERVMADAALAGYFEDVDMAVLRSHQRAFLAAALGGAEAYVGRGMAAAHADLGISSADFDRIVGHLMVSLTELGFRDDTPGSFGRLLEPLRSEIVTAS